MFLRNLDLKVHCIANKLYRLEEFDRAWKLVPEELMDIFGSEKKRMPRLYCTWITIM
jgi:hypothetical protein